MKNIFITCLLIMLCLCINIGNTFAATWQATLQSSFDIAETFDELQDWNSGGVWSNVYQYCGPDNTCPRTTNGEISRWQYYTNRAPTFEFTQSVGVFAVGDTVSGPHGTINIAMIHSINGHTYIQPTFATYAVASTYHVGDNIRSSDNTKAGTIIAWPTYIGNFAGNTWGGTGKSLCMDLGDNDSPDTAMSGLGAQRLGTYFGNGTTTSGLKKAYIFMMMKFSPNYFGNDPFQNGTNVLKFVDIASGFININTWGTPEERATINNPILTEYGENSIIFNWGGGGLSYPHSLFIMVSPLTAYYTGSAWTYNPSYPTYNETTSAIHTPYLNNEWFGIEIASDIGTIGNSDGSVEVWIYDKNGIQIGHSLRSNMTNLVQFNHLYNKTTIGGNRRYGINLSGRDLRYYVDDFIINSSRIGPRYFSLYYGSNIPMPPSNLIIR